MHLIGKKNAANALEKDRKEASHLGAHVHTAVLVKRYQFFSLFLLAPLHRRHLVSPVNAATLATYY